MRRLPICFALFCLLAAAGSAVAGSGRVIKVLPQFLDLEGRHTISPSLYERDAYQAILRRHADDTNRVSGIRFAVQWKARAGAPVKLRIELRGTARGDLPGRAILEAEVKPRRWFSRWTSLPIQGEDYAKLGQVTAWRVSLWDGDWLLSEQKSFLW
jgi:hypothetical protein